MSTPTKTVLVSLALASVLGACSDDDDDGGRVADAASLDAPSPDAASPDAASPDATSPDAGPPDAAPPDAGPPPTATSFSCTGTVPGDDRRQYVFNAIDVPTTAAESAMLGLDLDGDPMGRPDNALGQLLSTLASQADVDIQAIIDAAVAAGDVRQLLDLGVVDLTVDGDAAAQSFLGADCDDPANPADDFSGTESFGPDAAAITDAVLTGAVSSGSLRVAGGAGTVEVKMPFLGGILVRMPLRGVIVEAAISGGQVTGGRLGGAMNEADVDAVFIPALAEGLQSVIDVDCSGTAPDCCIAGSTGETLVDLFDENGDCAVTAEELRTNDLISSLLAPDVDLFDAGGNYAPRTDGVKDSLSLGIGFTTVTAVLPVAEAE